MLETTDDDPRSNSNFKCETLDSCARRGSASFEHLVFPWWDQPVASEFIGLSFFLIDPLVVSVDENVSLAVQKCVTGFVKEREPQVIIMLISEAQLN